MFTNVNQWWKHHAFEHLNIIDGWVMCSKGRSPPNNTLHNATHLIGPLHSNTSK